MFLCHKDILLLAAEGSYTRVYDIHGHVHLVCGHLHKLERRLPPLLFFRCHRASVINLDHVVELRRQAGRTATMLNGQEVQVSRRNWPRLLAMMKDG